MLPRRLRWGVLAALFPAVVWLAVASAASAPSANGRLLYISGEETRARLCVVRPRRGTPTAVVAARAGLNGAAWSPRGGRIAYSTRTASGDGHILVVSASGASPRTVLWGSDYYELAWSPDARWIAFVEWWSSRGPETAIGIVNTGSSRVKLRFVAGDIGSEDIGEYRSPHWSPDGRRIAFAFNTVGGPPPEIYTVSAVGGAMRRLTTNAASDTEPRWSPDGRRIAFASDRDGVDRIYVMNADGSGPRALTSGPHDESPVWSPDGRSVAFMREGTRRAAIRIADVRSGAERLVTYAPRGAFALDWQPLPRGTKLAPLPRKHCA